MAVEALCPTCGAVFSLKDEYLGKKVRCKKCEHVFTVGGEKAKERVEDDAVRAGAATAAPKRSSRDDDDDRTTRKPAAKRGRDDDGEEDRTRQRASRRGRDDDASRRGRDDDDDDNDRAGGKKRKRVYHDDDDDDDEPKRARRKASSGGAGKVVAIIGAVVAVLLLVCGGAIYGVYRWVERTANEVDDQFQQALNEAAKQDPNFAGFPGFERQPKDLADALASLKGNDAPGRRGAANWLAKQPLDPGRQAEVARALDPLLTEPDVNTRSAAMRALAVWATPDNVPGLAKALDDQKLEGIPNDANKDALAALGRLKDGRGAAAAARYLTNFFLRDAAAEALKQMGPVAEKAVLKYYFDRDGGTREKAQVLAQGCGAKDAAIIAQAVEDVRQGAHRDTRRDAARWLKTAKVDPQQQKAVASALESALVDTDNEVADAAMDALGTWATADTVPALVKMVEDSTTGGRLDNMRRKAMAVLGKLKDARGAEAVAARLTNGSDRRAAAEALIAMGPVAKPAVEKYVASPDQAVRREAERVLTNYGADGGSLKVTQILADLASPEARRRGDAARALTLMKVDEAQRAKVAQALEPAVADASDRGAQEQAVRALALWGAKENGPALVKIVEDKDKTPAAARYAAMDALAKWKCEEAIRPIALCIGPDRGDRDAAVRALIAMGPDLGAKIEAVAKEGLKSPDKNIVLDCVKVLGEVGTKASTAELNALAQVALRQKKNDVVTACQKAVLDIAARGNK